MPLSIDSQQESDMVHLFAKEHREGRFGTDGAEAFVLRKLIGLQLIHPVHLIVRESHRLHPYRRKSWPLNYSGGRWSEGRIPSAIVSLFNGGIWPVGDLTA